MSGTTLIYNGVKLRDCETKLFDQRIEYDESNTDVVFSRFRVRVTSTMIAYTTMFQSDHEATIRVDGDPAIAGSIPEQARRIHQLLSERGGIFYFYIKDAPNDGSSLSAGEMNHDMMLMAAGAHITPTTAVALDPENSGNGRTIAAGQIIDVESGPKPQYVSVDQIYGGRSLRVTFEVEVARKICDENFSDSHPIAEPTGTIPSSGSEILSNRWSIIESKDANWFTTRTLQGTLRVTSKHVIPHMLRKFVVPSLRHGYQRVSQSFATDPTDLVLKYRIEDKQRHEAPPQPAIDWSGQYIESASTHGTYQVGAVNLRLVGAPQTDKQELIGAAGQVITQRLRGLQKDPGDANDAIYKNTLLGASIVDVIGEPVIEMRVRIKRHEAIDEDKLRLHVKNVGEPLTIDGYSPDVWPVPLAYDGTSLAGVFSCYLQHPCSQWHAVPRYPSGDYESSSEETDRPGHEESEGYDSDDREYPSSEPLDVDKVSLDTSEHLSGYPYEYIRIRNDYETRTGRVQMPLAAAPATATDPTCRIVKLHGGLCRRIFQMEVSRIGRPPIIPQPADTLTDPNGITESLESVRIGVAAPEFKTDAISREFRVLAEYRYLLDRPPQIGEKLRMAISPIDATPDEDRLVDASYLFTTSKIEWNQSIGSS